MVVLTFNAYCQSIEFAVDTGLFKTKINVNSKSLNSGEVFFIVGTSKEGKIKQFKIKFFIPTCVSIYDKALKNGSPSVVGSFPYKYITISNSNEFSFAYASNDDIHYTRDGIMNFYVVPIQVGRGKIRAEYSWYNSRGEYFEGKLEGGEIIVNEEPDIKWKICKNDGRFNLRGQYIYNHDFEAYISEEAKIDLTLSNGAKSLEVKSFELPNNIDESKSWQLKGVVRLGRTVWDVDQSNIYFGGDCGQQPPPPPPPPPPCEQFEVKTQLNNDSLIVNWDIDNGVKNEFAISRYMVDSDGNVSYRENIAIVNENKYWDNDFINLPKSNYYIYSVRKNNSSFSNKSLPVFKSSPFFVPEFTTKHVEFEGGVGINITNDTLRAFPYLKIGFSKIAFNNKFSVLPVNIFINSHFNNDISLSNLVLFEFAQKGFSFRFGGGLRVMLQKNIQPFYTPEISASLILNNGFSKQSTLKRFRLVLSANYSAISPKHKTYYGLFFGINYSLYK